MPNRQNKKGRSRYDAKHVRFYDFMLSSPAYLDLSCQARAILIEIVRLYDGTNNGRIALSIRTAAQRCRISKDTATRAFAELRGHGFVECVTPGAFSRKVRHAAEWRIAWRSCDVTGDLPRNPFMRWDRQKQNTVLTYSTAVP